MHMFALLSFLAPSPALAIDVGVCSASSYVDDTLTKLRADPAITSVTGIDCGASTPSLDDLRAYDAVLFFSDSGFADGVGLGNVLADYVDEGFGAAEAVFSVADNIKIQGRFLDEGYRAINAGTQASGALLSLVPVEPGHPLLAGVSVFDGGSASYHGNDALPAPTATLVANWSDGDALVAEHVPSGAGTVVALNFYPPSSDIRADFWNAGTNGVQLMVNALEYAAGGGVSSLVISGSCPGRMRIEASGLTPRGTFAVLLGSGPGSDVLPGGPCAGVASGLSDVRYITSSLADPAGEVLLTPTVPDGRCGATVQILDVVTCSFTDTARL